MQWKLKAIKIKSNENAIQKIKLKKKSEMSI